MPSLATPDDPSMDLLEQGTERWLAAMYARRRRTNHPSLILAPWDELPYFNLPINTKVTVGAGAFGISVCQANPNRVVLILSAGANSQVFVSTTNEAVAGVGIPIAANFLPLILTQADHGNLPQLAWFGNATIANTVYVTEVILREFPRS